MSDETPRALVVGGPEAFFNGKLMGNLKSEGIDAEWHWPWKSNGRPTSLPAGCSAVIVLKDMVSHSLHDHAKALASEADVPCAVIPRKMAQAISQLEDKGLIRRSRGGEVSEETVRATIHEYVIDQVERRGQKPSRNSIRAAVRRAHGLHAPSDDEIIIGARDKAMEMLEQKRTAAVEARKTTEEEARLAASMVLENTPELGTLDVLQQVKDLVGDGPLPSDKRTKQLISVTRKTLKSKWSNPSSEEEKIAVAEKQAAWVERHLRGVAAQRGNMSLQDSFPSFRDLQVASRRIFGRTLTTLLITKAQEKLLAEAAQAPAPPTPTPEKLAAENVVATPEELDDLIESPWPIRGYKQDSAHANVQTAFEVFASLTASQKVGIYDWTALDLDALKEHQPRKEVLEALAELGQTTYVALLYLLNQDIETTPALHIYRRITGKKLGHYVLKIVKQVFTELDGKHPEFYVRPKRFEVEISADLDPSPPVGEVPEGVVNTAAQAAEFLDALDDDVAETLLVETPAHDTAAQVAEALETEQDESEPFEGANTAAQVTEALEALPDVSPVDPSTLQSAINVAVADAVRPLLHRVVALENKVTAQEKQIMALEDQIAELQAGSDLGNMTLNDLLEQGFGFKLVPPTDKDQ